MAEKFKKIFCGDYMKADLANQILNDAGIQNALVQGVEEISSVSPPYRNFGAHIMVFENDVNKAVEILKSNKMFDGSEKWLIIE